MMLGYLVKGESVLGYLVKGESVLGYLVKRESVPGYLVKRELGGIFQRLRDDARMMSDGGLLGLFPLTVQGWLFFYNALWYT